MAILPASIISKINNAPPVNNGGSFINHGRYVFIVENFLIKDGYRGISAIAELYVAESYPAADGREHGGPPNAVGSRASCIWKLTGGSPEANDVNFQKLRDFIEHLVGHEVVNKIREDAEWGRNPDERFGKLVNDMPVLCHGAFIGDETTLARIQKGPNAGTLIVNHRWSHIETSEDDQAENLQRLKMKPSGETPF